MTLCCGAGKAVANTAAQDSSKQQRRKSLVPRIMAPQQFGANLLGITPTLYNSGARDGLYGLSTPCARVEVDPETMIDFAQEPVVMFGIAGIGGKLDPRTCFAWG